MGTHLASQFVVVKTASTRIGATSDPELRGACSRDLQRAHHLLPFFYHTVESDVHGFEVYSLRDGCRKPKTDVEFVVYGDDGVAVAFLQFFPTPLDRGLQ
jgi:hypothetical protein